MNKKLLCKICGGETKTRYCGLYDDRHGYPGKFNLRECHDCGFMQTEPQLTNKEIGKIYSKYYPRSNITSDQVKNSAQNMPSREVVLKKGLGGTCHFDTKKGERVLDIGSGAGYSLAEIKKLGGIAYGVDPDTNAQRIAKELGFKFKLGFLEDCNFPRRYFDLITASQVLEHTPNPIGLLISCKGLLKNSGRIKMSFPNTGALYQKLWGRYWLHWHIPYHLNHFNKRSIETMAEKAGLRITKLETVTPNLWTVLQIRSCISRVKIGQRNTMWDTGVIDKKSVAAKKSIFSRVLLKVLPLVENWLFVNRILDRFGLGESFVVELRL